MEAWISEKQQLLIVPHLGDNKHDAFETDISVHGDRCTDICEAGQKLIYDRNHHADSIAQRCEQLCNKIYNLGELANIRKFNLLDNSTYLQFMWKADVMESWIADKEARVKSRSLSRAGRRTRWRTTSCARSLLATPTLSTVGSPRLAA